MLKAVSGEWFTDRLCEIFELDASIVSHVELDFEAYEAVTSIVSEEDAEEVITLLKKYVLIEAVEEENG